MLRPQLLCVGRSRSGSIAIALLAIARAPRRSIIFSVMVHNIISSRHRELCSLQGRPEIGVPWIDELHGF